MRTLSVSLLCAVMLLAVASAANGAYIYPWASTPNVSDGVLGTVSPATDIVSLWYEDDATYHYFRLDIEGAPSSSDFAGLYSIIIDSKAGGADGELWPSYLPDGVYGIDYFIDMHYEPTFGGFWAAHLHEYDSDGDQILITTLSTSDYQYSENGGTTLEWRVAKSGIGGTADFTIRAATHDQGSSVDTYDLAPNGGSSGYTVPEPVTAALVAFGGVVVLLHRRRRR